MDSVIVFHGQSFLICLCDIGLTDSPIFVAKEPIYELSIGEIDCVAMWLSVKTLIKEAVPGGEYTLKGRVDPATWSITVDKRGARPEFINFWYSTFPLPPGVPWTTYNCGLKRFAQMPIYEANDLLEKLRIFIGLI
jgi:hypothetical protein